MKNCKIIPLDTLHLKLTLLVMVTTGFFLVAGPALARQGMDSESGTPRIALITNYYEPDSHADVIGTKFIEGFVKADGSVSKPEVEVVSMWIDQSTPDDMGHDLSEKHDIPIYDSVRAALTLGDDSLKVDGVLFIGEHGSYPDNRFGAEMYPRVEVMEQIFRVFEESRRSVPVFIDKHLSHNWYDARWILDRAADLDVPLMAGSSLPVAERRPELEHARGTSIEEAVAVGYGSRDSYGFHVLEILQSMLERRKGGETGITSVQALSGREVYERADEGLFSIDIAEAACQRIDARKEGRIRDNEPNPTAIVIKYADGTQGTVLIIGRHIGGNWAYAARKRDGTTVSTRFKLDEESGHWSHFTYLGLNVQQMFLTGEPQVSVQRTLVTSGILDEALRSLANDGEPRRTPHMADIEYKSPENEVFRWGRGDPRAE